MLENKNLPGVKVQLQQTVKLFDTVSQAILRKVLFSLFLDDGRDKSHKEEDKISFWQGSGPQVIHAQILQRFQRWAAETCAMLAFVLHTSQCCMLAKAMGGISTAPGRTLWLCPAGGCSPGVPLRGLRSDPSTSLVALVWGFLRSLWYVIF